jgi:hypothetical protein
MRNPFFDEFDQNADVPLLVYITFDDERALDTMGTYFFKHGRGVIDATHPSAVLWEALPDSRFGEGYKLTEDGSIRAMYIGRDDRQPTFVVIRTEEVPKDS